MWELVELLIDAVGWFRPEGRDRRDRRPRGKGCGFAVLIVLVFVVVFLIVFNL